MKKQKSKQEKIRAEKEKKRYIATRTTVGLALLAFVIAVSVSVIAYLRMQLTGDQLFETNRTRVQTVINGLEAGVMEKDGLYEEYDRLYIAKLLNTEYYYGDFSDVTLDDAFAKEAAEYADIASAAVIDRDGNTYGSWNCDYDFTRTRFRMLRACGRGEGVSEPFSIAYKDGTIRFFGKEIADDRILVFAQDWTETENNIKNMTSWEAVLRGMVSVDTVSIAVSLKDYTFLYNPIDDLTGKDALQNGVPISSLGDSYEGKLVFGGDEWCVVGRKWNDAVVFVMTRSSTDLANDTVLIIFLAILFIVFIALLSAYGIIINRDNIKLGKTPGYIVLLRQKRSDGGERHLLNFNVSVAKKLFPIAVVGIVTLTAMSYYVQSVNALASIAYESNQAIGEIGNKLRNNTSDAEAVNTEYKEMFLSKSVQITKILEEHPELVFAFDPEAENVHRHPVEKNDSGRVISGLDSYGNVCYSVSEQEFLQNLCDINAIERISLFDEYGRILATNSDEWYYVMTGDEESQAYPFWEILAEHRDFYAQDITYDEEGQYSQYIGNAFYYYTVQNEDGSTGFATYRDYKQQLDGSWTGSPIEKHRGMLQINIAPERLRSVVETATMTYVADHTTIHGTGHTVICDTSDEHLCVYSPKEGDIGKPASAMGYSANAFNETGEMYNGYETVNGVKYFQTFKLVDDYNYYIGTAVPLSTVFATRDRLALTTLITAFFGLLVIFLYTCCFGEKEEKMYCQNPGGEEEERIRNEQDLITLTMPSGKTHRVRSAASRWDAEYVPWWQKTPEQKFSAILRIVFFVFADFLFACILLSRSGIIEIDAINYVYEGVWTKGFNIFAMTNCVITLIMVFVVANVAELLIENLCYNIGSRAETLGHLFSSVLHYGTALFAVFYTLYLCGMDTGSLIASAGIMSLVIGLGAQSMIQDILAGVFIVFEGAFRVGDIVTIGDFRGSVLEIGLRTTKIEDTAKNIKVFNNSTLSGIINMTKEVSVAAVDVGIAYGESIEQVEKILEKELPKMAKRLPAITEGPYYKGVSMLSGSSVDIKIIAMCKESDRLQLVRDLNREMLILLQKNNITIPFPQVTVSYLEESAPPTEEEREEAGRFVAEQKEKERHEKETEAK